MPARLRLTARQKRVWYLKYCKGVPARVIAKELGITVSAVHRLLRRAHIRRLGIARPARRAPEPRWIRPTSFTQCYDL